MTKINKWKVATIILAVTLISLAIYYDKTKDKLIDVNGIMIKESDLGNIYNLAINNNLSGVIVTDINNSKSVKLILK